MKGKLFLGFGVLLILAGFLFFSVSCETVANVKERHFYDTITLYTDKGSIQEGVGPISERTVTFISLNGLRDETIQYSMGDRSLDVEIPTSTGEKVIVTFDRIQYPQQVNFSGGLSIMCLHYGQTLIIFRNGQSHILFEGGSNTQEPVRQLAGEPWGDRRF
jgi:hypothetical protein